MKKQILLMGATGVLICGMMMGCSKNEETTEVTTQATTEVATEATTEEVVLKVIGIEDEDAFWTVLTNETGQDIVSITIYDTVSEEYCDELLEDEDVFVNGEQRILYYPKVKEDASEITEVSTEQNDEDEKLVSVGYDVKIVLADESEYVLHAFPFGELEEAVVLIEDEVAYIENDEICTKEAELATLELENQEEEPATQSTTNNNQSTTQTITQPVTQPESQPVVTPEPAPVEQDSENCIGDEGLFY